MRESAEINLKYAQADPAEYIPYITNIYTQAIEYNDFDLGCIDSDIAKRQRKL